PKRLVEASGHTVRAGVAHVTKRHEEQTVDDGEVDDDVGPPIADWRWTRGHSRHNRPSIRNATTVPRKAQPRLWNADRLEVPGHHHFCLRRCGLHFVDERLQPLPRGFL